ncbi:hypothetical protein D5086_025125 [Populus alba]|uniref:Uncharacterized protein n=1 Tax=Populus alba TaxID=43335 RepID=A0ACC4B7F8_POPAL
MYTGDFLWEVDSKRAKDARNRLLDVLKNETIDVLYLDNTYRNSSYDFPTREVAAQQVGFYLFLVHIAVLSLSGFWQVLTINVHCGEWILVDRDEV